MIRLQVEAHVGAVTNPEAAREAGYAVAIVARKIALVTLLSLLVNASTTPPAARGTSSSA